MSFGICVLASGRGSNFLAILKAIEQKTCSAKVLCLISDKSDAKALEIAKENSIPTHIILRSDFSSSPDFDEELLKILDSYSPKLIVLAGYMRILHSPKIFSKYGGHIINIHPSLLPKYPGAQAQKDAFEAGEKISGLTIHLVDETLDGGKILYQKKVDISSCKSAQEVASKILEQEHISYPLVIDKILRGK